MCHQLYRNDCELVFSFLCVIFLGFEGIFHWEIIAAVGLDGSTSGLERERLINRFNAASNSDVHLFLLSTR